MYLLCAYSILFTLIAMNKKKLITYLVLFVVVAVAVATRVFGGGVTFYVSPNGNDANNGEEASPVRSIHQAQKLAEPFFGKKESILCSWMGCITWIVPW